jgi:hypothetical protein
MIAPENKIIIPNEEPPMLNRIQLPTYASEQDTPFEIIYQAAKSQNKAPIEALLNAACIDVQNKTYMTPVAKLAEENDVGAVNFLIKNFDASLRWAIFGYARGLHFDPLNKILDDYEGNTTFLLCEVVYGLVYAKRQDIAKRVLDNHPDKWVLLLKYYAYGLGHSCTGSNDLLIEIPDKYLAAFRINQCRGYGYSGDAVGAYLALQFWNDLDNKIMKELARAYAMVDSTKTIENLFIKFPQHRLILLPEIVNGYAQSGLHHRINALFQQNEMIFSQAVTSAYEGLLAGGHLSQARILQQQLPADYFTPGTSISYLSSYGHVTSVKKVLASQPELWPVAIEELMKQGQLEMVTQRLLADPAQVNLYTVKIVNALAELGDVNGVIAIIEDNTEQLDELLEAAVAHFARGGHHDELYLFLKTYPQHNLWQIAAEYLAVGSYCRDALKIITDEYDTPNLELQKTVAKGFISISAYTYAYVLWKTLPRYADESLTCMAEAALQICKNENDILVMLAAINFAGFRANLATRMQTLTPAQNLRITPQLPQAAKLNEIMQREVLPFYLAKFWLDKLLQFQLMQGHLLVNKMKIPSAVYFHILTFSTGLKKQDLNKLGFQMLRFMEELKIANKKVNNKKNTILKTMLTKNQLKPCWQAQSAQRTPLADRSNVARFR